MVFAAVPGGLFSRIEFLAREQFEFSVFEWKIFLFLTISRRLIWLIETMISIRSGMFQWYPGLGSAHSRQELPTNCCHIKCSICTKITIGQEAFPICTKFREDWPLILYNIFHLGHKLYLFFKKTCGGVQSILLKCIWQIFFHLHVWINMMFW